MNVIPASYKTLTIAKGCCCSVAESCPTLCDSMGCSTSGFSVLHCLPQLAQTHVHWVIDAIQPPHPLLPPFPPALCLSQCWLFVLDGQRTGASASALVLPMNIQGWFPLGLTDLISLQSKGFLKVFSSITVQKHRFFSAQSPLWSNSYIHTWPQEKP